MSDFEIGGQISMFEGNHKFKLMNPIRLIELFGGIGAQAKALERLKVDFEHYKLCEIDKYAVKSYNAIHGTNFEPSDITKLHGGDLDITDTDKYCYIMTYSFPCQDLSSAGNGAGMAKGSGTRSGLLWEVERLLTETKELPQVLLMENVPGVIGKKNIEHFAEWINFLNKLGYKSKWALLNAKDYGIPQNRNRCFMISVLGEYYYEFPQPITLEKRLKDLLEDKVAEKYYLSDRTVQMFVECTKRQQKKGNGFKFEPTTGDSVAHSVLTRNGERPCDNFIKCEQVAQITDSGFTEMTGRVYSQQVIIDDTYGFEEQAREYRDLFPTIRAERNGVKIIEPTIWGSKQEHCAVNKDGICPTLTEAMGKGGGQIPLHNYDYRIRKLTPKECWRLMNFDDGDIDRAKAVGISDSQLYRQAGNSICVNVLVEIFRKMI